MRRSGDHPSAATGIGTRRNSTATFPGRFVVGIVFHRVLGCARCECHGDLADRGAARTGPATGYSIHAPNRRAGYLAPARSFAATDKDGSTG